MKVVSLFDGIGCGYQALKKLGVKVNEYHAFEIDEACITVAKERHPDTIHHGNVVGYDFKNLAGADLLIGGSPCQGFSFAGKMLAFEDPRSKLFFEFVRAKEEIQPRNWLLENVRMKRAYADVISEHLGLPFVEINSALVSAQNRPRYYWCNWPVLQPEDKNIYFKTIDEAAGPRDPVVYTETRTEEAKQIRREAMRDTGRDFSPRRGKELKPRTDGKMNCLTANLSNKEHMFTDSRGRYRKLTPVECERLQTLPDNYTFGASDTQRYKMVGNGWNVDTITHVLKEGGIDLI